MVRSDRISATGAQHALPLARLAFTRELWRGRLTLQPSGGGGGHLVPVVPTTYVVYGHPHESCSKITLALAAPSWRPSRLPMRQNESMTRPPLVLIACDQEWSGRSLESILGPRGYAVLRAYTGRQAIELARTTQPDAVIIDFRLPDLDGVDVCRTLRDNPSFSSTTPIVMTATGHTNRAQRLAAYHAGAWEYCVQPLDGDLLIAKLDTFIRCKSEVDRVRDESLTDQLTGLYNVRGLARRAKEIGAEALRTHHALACVAFGPDASVRPRTEDELRELEQQIAERIGGIMRAAGRASDAIGRLGQNDFAIVAPSTPATGAVRLVERMREKMEGASIELRGGEHPIMIRAGYAAVADMAESPVEADEMLLRAVQALHDLRSEGNGSFVRSYEQIANVAS
jgi:two-component system cell cycle response regulator